MKEDRKVAIDLMIGRGLARLVRLRRLPVARRDPSTGLLLIGGRDAKDRRGKEGEMQELRRQGHLEKRRQGGAMSAMQRDWDQAVKRRCNRLEAAVVGARR